MRWREVLEECERDGAVADATFEKVTVYVVRDEPGGHELLTFQHPTGGQQMPAGSDEEGETAAAAATREVMEETGVGPLQDVLLLGEAIEVPDGEAVALRDDPVDDPDGNEVQTIKRGHRVRIEDAGGPRLCVAQLLYDLNSVPPREVPGIRGRASRDDFASPVRRSFFFARAPGDNRRSWTHAADGHLMAVEWRPLAPAPGPISAQAAWLSTYADAIGARLREGGP